MVSFPPWSPRKIRVHRGALQSRFEHLRPKAGTTLQKLSKARRTTMRITQSCFGSTSAMVGCFYT